MTRLSRPSPNHDLRALPVSMMVLHYTGMETGKAAIERLADPAAKGSAHYVVEEDGAVIAMVDEAKRAWHAGLSYWRGITDVNSASVGIEIVNGGHDFALPDFPETQIVAVIALSREIIARHGIAPVNVVGHSDIAPGRKIDPGEKFPWERLARQGVGLWPAGAAPAPPDEPHAAFLLTAIGYNPDLPLETILTEFQRRYRPARFDGVLDDETMGLIEALAGKAAPA
ncbi:N-acetylmuramoyl-L-alanine amidase [Glycocaulis sp.]|uniref:N-acetylmuramoyl-L-alanine amidase n=1 Tax=Glycocaulis sp. TaxID=1969725 RepID=UPI0025BA1C9E|nr:N-acetylmuramoyl-L-alanine amidase [Glycocaulis sp.]MCH8522300.1 N-acetylmuramoyl-L-alanine amidase [Glycocaulis sp.]